MKDPEDFVPKLTNDGSSTFFSSEFGELFHSYHGARQEARLKFVEPLQLAQRALQPRLRLLDICYGLGYNTAAALATIWAINPNCCVEVVCLELNPSVPQAAVSEVHGKSLLADHLLGCCHSDCTGGHFATAFPHASVLQLLTQLATEHQVQTNRLHATLLVGDARATIRLVHLSGFRADAVFLDPFSPTKCPQLWTVEFLEQVAKCLYLDGKLATYSCAAAVRIALMASGLKIGPTPPVGRRSPGTVASWVDTDLPVLSRQEQEHLLTRAAVPYRDPQLNDAIAVILRRRIEEQQASSLEPTSHWRKRTCSQSLGKIQ